MAYVKINDEHLTNYANSIRQAKNNNKHYTPEQLEDEIQGLAEKTIEQEITITRQNNTIDQLNSRVPKMYTPPIVTPSGITQQITPPPDEDYDGLSSVTVAPVITPEIRLQNKLVDPTSNTQLIEADEGYDGLASVSVTGTSYMNIDLQKWVSPSPDDEPFEMIFEKEVRKYVAYGQIKMVKATILTATSIGGSAFQGCTALIKVNLPDSLTSISQYAFQNCTSLTELTLPDSLTSISQYAFQNCTSLTELTLPDSLTSIGANAFYNCTSLTELTLPDALTSIGNYAFQNCTSLTELTLPDSLTSIGGSAFQNCASLTELTLPDSLTSIGANAFYDCASLTNLTLTQGFNCKGLNVSASTRFTAETIVSWLEALADRTGETAYTLKMGTTNLNKLTAEQKAIATNKNWNLA